jgi:hypothetical protein
MLLSKYNRQQMLKNFKTTLLKKSVDFLLEEIQYAILDPSNLYAVHFTGIEGPGEISVANASEGDVIVMLTNLTDGTGAEQFFEGIILEYGKITQFSNDQTGKKFVALLMRAVYD